MTDEVLPKIILPTPSEFGKIIESFVSEHDVSYLDAIINFSEKNGVELEVIASLVKQNQKLKQRLMEECMDLNLVEKMATLKL